MRQVIVFSVEDIFNDKHRKLYIQGYTFGLLPVFHDCEDMLRIAPHFQNEAFISGFCEGRHEYERLNGPLHKGIPEKIITEKILADYFMDGRLGLPIDLDGYTGHQRKIILQYYNSGVSYYSQGFDSPLHDLLAQSGIGM